MWTLAGERTGVVTNDVRNQNRAAVDPDGVFLNDFLRGWFDVSRDEAVSAAPPRRPAEPVSEGADAA